MTYEMLKSALILKIILMIAKYFVQATLILGSFSYHIAQSFCGRKLLWLYESIHYFVIKYLQLPVMDLRIMLVMEIIRHETFAVA